jgi:hypothetical protein
VKAIQALLALALCAIMLMTFGLLYAVAAGAAALVAVAAGTRVLLGIGVGLVWPVLVLAYVIYVTREVSRRAAQGATAPAAPLWGPEARLSGIEDPKHRE